MSAARTSLPGAPLAPGQVRYHRTTVGTYRLAHAGRGLWELRLGGELIGFYPRQLAAENALSTDARRRASMTFESGVADGADDRRKGLSASPAFKAIESPEYVRGYGVGYDSPERYCRPCDVFGRGHRCWLCGQPYEGAK